MTHAQAITGTTHLITLIGNPTRHSLSPAIHNASFARAGVDAVCLCFNITYEDTLPEVLSALRSLDGWDGTNVTMPYKRAVVSLLDDSDNVTQLSGSVNVIEAKDGMLCGYNTDGAGFWHAVRHAGVDPKGKKITLVGCGGAGSAIFVQAALDGVAAIDVAVRTGGGGWCNAITIASRLSRFIDCSIRVIDLSDRVLGASLCDSDILVNATPIGMGQTSAVPVPSHLYSSSMVVADVIYSPRETLLIRQAKAKGCTTVTGLEMLLEQAALSEKIWYGIDMDIPAIAASL